MSKKILAIVMSLVLVAGIVCVFASCGGNGNDTQIEAPAGNEQQDASSNTASDLAYIKDKGTMIIGIT